MDKKPECFGEPTQEDGKCNKCPFLDECIDCMWETGSDEEA